MAWRPCGLCATGQPMRAPMAAASSMTAEQKASTSGSASTRSMVAPVIAATGFIVMLPHNLYQMSWRTSLECVASKPACVSSSARPCTRALRPPAGSPTISPCPARCCTTPGSGDEVLACTTQPTTWRIGMARSITPSGSTLAKGVAPSNPGCPAQNHHGTPFIAGITRVFGPSSGAMPRATATSAGPLTAITTRSCAPNASARSEALATGAASTLAPSAARSRQPCCRSAASVAPRANALTCAWPAAASRVPMNPPMAPAPMMQIFMKGSVLRGADLAAAASRSATPARRPAPPVGGAAASPLRSGRR